MSADLIAIALFAHKKDNRPLNTALTWPDLGALLTRHDVRADKDGLLWSPTRYPLGVTRANENVAAMTAAVYEFDGCTPDQAGLEGMEYIIHSTFHHGLAKDGHPAGPSLRLVIRLSREVLPAEWPRVWRGGLDRYARGADRGCKDLHRLYYLPSCPPGGPAPETRIGQGVPLDPDRLPPLPAEDREPARQPDRTARAATGDRPGDRFSAETPWSAILCPHGWRRGRDSGDQEVWIRPGKDDDGARSANTTEANNLWIWSSNAAPFEAGQSYSKLHAFVLLEHGGDWTAAVRALGERYDPRLVLGGQSVRMRRLVTPTRPTDTTPLPAPIRPADTAPLPAPTRPGGSAAA